MKVLFLDCDGVLNSEANIKQGLFNTVFPVDQYMAFLVGKIQLNTDCKVVLSSAWRHHEPSVEKLNKQLVPIFDITPDLDLPRVRGDEIKAWLDEHSEVTKYAILDDDTDMLPEQLPNFFQTQWKVGITEEIMNKVIAHLNDSSARSG
jgi:hypothetical protein